MKSSNNQIEVSNKCYAGHHPSSGEFYKAWDRMALIHCVDNYAWER